ncbi:MAG TPA: chromosome partitioning protein ParA [Deltaproteobacteria bacterium]|nr:chromosome partitioning protein ParA [Deltaproteobacteria bacterium]
MSMLTDKIKSILTLESSTALSSLDVGKKRATLVSICSQKGGVGKTTTAVNLGTAIAKYHSKKVLVVDLDPQGHVEKSLGGIIPEGVEYLPMSTVLSSKQGNVMDGVISTDLENFFITPGDKTLYETESLLATKIGKEYILREAMKIARSQFDFVIFDCPPNLGNLTLNALVASDFCVVPCEMSVLAFEGVNDLVETLETVNERLNPRLKILGVLLTRVDGRNVNMNQIIETNIQNIFRGKVFKSQIAINTALNKAQLEGLPVYDNYAGSSGSINYQELAEEILKKLKRQNNPSQGSKLQAASG